MVGRVEMPGGVLILRIVTAADMSAGETEAQVYPGISHFQTVLTSLGARCDVVDLIKMRTSLCHVLFLSDACVRLGPAPYFLLEMPTTPFSGPNSYTQIRLTYPTDVYACLRVEYHFPGDAAP
jgi:hypothetical protein